MEKTIIHFSNQFQMREYLNNSPSKHYQGKELHSEIPRSFSFCPVSWETALEQFEKGIPENVAELKKSVEQVHKDFAKQKTVTKLDYVGQKPHVPRALQGQPKAMIHRVKTKTPTKVINICYNITAGAMTTFDELEKAGNTVAQLITALELSNFKVNLEVCAGGTDFQRKEHFYYGYTVKKSNQKLDLLRITFPIQSPAMFRRIGFKMMEIIPTKQNITKGCGGYGLCLWDEDAFALEYYPVIGFKKDNSYYLDVVKVRAANFDYKKLLKMMN